MFQTSNIPCCSKCYRLIPGTVLQPLEMVVPYYHWPFAPNAFPLACFFLPCSFCQTIQLPNDPASLVNITIQIIFRSDWWKKGKCVKNAAEEHFVHFYSSEKKQKKHFTWKLYFHFVTFHLFALLSCSLMFLIPIQNEKYRRFKIKIFSLLK